MHAMMGETEALKDLERVRAVADFFVDAAVANKDEDLAPFELDVNYMRMTTM